MTTRTITLLRSGLLLSNAKGWLRSKVDNAVAALFRWALAKRPVQEVVANAFNGSTPMCRVLQDYVHEAAEEAKHDIDADDVQGLERMIEDAVESGISNAFDNFDVSDVPNFEEAVREAVSHRYFLKDLAEELTEEVAKQLAQRLTKGA